MEKQARSPLQNVLADAIARADRTRDHFDGLLRKKLGTTGKPLWDVERGKVKKPSPRVLRAMEEVLSLPPDYLVDLVHPRGETQGRPELPNSSPPQASRMDKAPDVPPTRSADAGETTPIISLDLSLPMGPGATVDDYIEDEPLLFDLAYIRGFTRTEPSRLRLARGVGDSMWPTLQSYDRVWIDSTQRHLNQSDRIWAVSINGGAAIKRLRPLKGNRVLVISDNPGPGHDNYEVGRDEILIGGRVIRFSRDL